MKGRLEFVVVLLLGVLAGALLDVAFGPILSFEAREPALDRASEPDRVAGEEPRPALAGAPRAPGDPRRPPEPPAAPPEVPPEEPARAHPPSSLPTAVLDVYAALNARAYRSFLAPVPAYSVLDDLETVVTGGEGPAEEVPLEDAARAAASRRRDVRLPANRFLALGIPVGAQHHEVLVGVLPATDAGGAEPVLRNLAKDAGLDPGRLDRTSPAYKEALTVAESYVRERIRVRALEQAFLARAMSPAGGRHETLAGQCFVVLPDRKGLVALRRGTDARLDALIDAYVRAPERERAALLEMRPR